MILRFSEDKFKERILSGVKIHEIQITRTERWKKGQIIHFWRGNPKDTKSEPKPHQFHECNCRSVQDITIQFELETHKIHVKIDNKLISEEQAIELAIGNGFDSIEDLKDWFFSKLEQGFFRGRLIHWTKKTY